MKKETISSIIAAVSACLGCTLLTACREATKVSYNVSKEADNFNVLRKITVVEYPMFVLGSATIIAAVVLVLNGWTYLDEDLKKQEEQIKKEIKQLEREMKQQSDEVKKE